MEQQYPRREVEKNVEAKTKNPWTIKFVFIIYLLFISLSVGGRWMKEAKRTLGTKSTFLNQVGTLWRWFRSSTSKKRNKLLEKGWGWGWVRQKKILIENFILHWSRERKTEIKIRLCGGWEWVILRSHFVVVCCTQKDNKKGEEILSHGTLVDYPFGGRWTDFAAHLKLDWPFYNNDEKKIPRTTFIRFYTSKRNNSEAVILHGTKII